MNAMKVLGLYQVVCGAMAFLMSMIPSHGPITTQNRTVWTLSAALFCAFSILSGIMLLLRKSAGFQLTFVNQLIQIPQVAFAGTIYRNICGIGFNLGFHLEPIYNFQYAVQPPHFSLYLNVQENIAYFTINIIAVALAIYTIVLMRKYKAAQQETERDNMDIGRNI